MPAAPSPGAAAARKDWARAHFRGLENVLAPSFDADLRELDEEGLRLDVRQSIRHGCFSTACALDAGLTLAEKKRMVSVAVQEAAGRIGVSVAPGAIPLEETLEVLAHAEAAGATHVHLGYPQDFQPRDARDLIAYVRQVSAATGLALCLVVSDRHAFHALHPSGVPLEALEELAGLENVVALELGSLDAGLVLECCERFGDRLLVSSPHLALLPMLCSSFAVQWSGPWAVEALQSPERRYAVELFEHLVRGRTTQAMAIYWQLAPALGATARVAASYAHAGAQHWPLLKYQQWLSGGNGGMTRQPVMRLFQRDMQAIRASLAAIGVECAQDDAEFFRGRSARGGRT